MIDMDVSGWVDGWMDEDRVWEMCGRRFGAFVVGSIAMPGAPGIGKRCAKS